MTTDNGQLPQPEGQGISRKILMNIAQAKRIALAVKGDELILCEVPDCITEALGDADDRKVGEALQSLG